MIRGIGTSKGIGIGYALKVETPEIKVKRERAEDAESEKKRYEQAKNRFTEETEAIIERLEKKLKENDKTALVLKNQIYLIEDVEMNEGILGLIEREHLCAEAAVDATCKMYEDIFSAMDSELMNQRVADIEDLRHRIIALLSGVKQLDLSKLPPDTVIVAGQLQPSLAAVMDTEHVAGIIAEHGGETSHAAILARALGIPAVLSVKDITKKVSDGDTVIVDGEYGEVFIKPISKTIEIYKKKRGLYLEKTRELKKYIDKDTSTADGHNVCLAANIGSSEEASKAMESGADGVGLFRTEYLFLDGVSSPTEEQQFEEYKRAAVICKKGALTIRTIDISADKNIPYLGLAKEKNPFLGYRAIRFCLGRLDIFIAQLRAILRASAYGNVRIMIPLVTSLEEITAVKDIVLKIMEDFDRHEIPYDREIKIGVLIETPAAALISDVLAKEVDFFSIGTNDLTQYTAAVDRGNENVAYLYSVFHPAVIRLIRDVIKNAKSAGIEVGMCGEAAANPCMIPLLLSFGLEVFSVAPPVVLETRKNIASWTLKEAGEVAANVFEMRTEKEISNYLSDYIAEKGEK